MFARVAMQLWQCPPCLQYWPVPAEQITGENKLACTYWPVAGKNILPAVGAGTVTRYYK
jgi:hypothetical protein